MWGPAERGGGGCLCERKTEVGLSRGSIMRAIVIGNGCSLEYNQRHASKLEDQSVAMLLLLFSLSIRRIEYNQRHASKLEDQSVAMLLLLFSLSIRRIDH